MKNTLKAIYLLLLFSILTICSSCAGQNPPENPGTPPAIQEQAPGDTVPEITDKGIMVIFQDKKGNHWFAGGEKGAYQYDGKNLILFTTKDGLRSHSILGIQEDKWGNMYFDTSEGISKFDGKKFTTLAVTDSSASGNEWKREPDDLWFRMGWDENGPYRYDGKSLHKLTFPKTDQENEFYAKYPHVSYNPYGLYSIYHDSQGNVWFGTSSLGLCRFDGKSIRWLYEDQLTETPAGGAFGIRSMIEDKAGYFWFCNTRYRYEILPDSSARPETNQLNYRKEKGIGYSRDQKEINFPYFMSIVADDTGDLWMATYSDGVYRNDGQKLIHYPIKDGETDVLLFSIYRDHQGVIWLGTHNAGVYRFKGMAFNKYDPFRL